MSVTEYKNIECKYRIDKLDNVVYLVPENALRNIHIDGDEAYVDNIPFEPLRIDCYNIALSDTDEFDERYKFTHQLTFSVNGYASHNTLDGNYYAIVKSVDNEYWLVNPMFPCKVTYTYKLGYMENHTDFTLSTISNHPTLRIHGMNQGKPFICHDYFLNSFDRLFLNEKRYSTHVGSDIHYTNSGFCEVVYDKKSASFTETFDGKNVSHSIQFNIKFDDYKDSWHYNLLEFTDNLYSAVITSTKGEYVLCGFHFGLQPSYTVTSNGESTPDYIQINLVDMHDNGDLITYITGGTISPITTTEYKYTLEYDAWECVSDGYAQYLLKKEVDALDNPTGNYMCLSGYTEQFSFLGDKLVGTFDETDTFFQPQCKIGECKLYTSLTSPVKMWAQQCKSFSVKADSDWSITNNASYLQFTPSSGEADTEYTVQLCNFREQSAATVTTSFTINYCSTSSTYNVQIGKGSGCFYGGDEFNISPDAQYVVVPVECCVSAASETTSALTNIQIFDNYIRVYVPQNTGDSARTFTLDVTLCDSTGEIVTINQANGYERWVTEGYTCIGKLKCEVQRKYTGTTSGDINTWTEVVRTYGCIPSSECGGSMTRWIDTEDTVCYEGRKYIVQIEQVKPSTDSPWINTGNQRRGDETPDSPAECSGTTLEEWRVESGYTCDNTTKYELLRLFVSLDSGQTWTATDTYKKGVVLEYDSVDCGYVPPSGETIYEWRVEGTDCDGFDLYYREQKYVSDDDGNTWSPTGTYRLGSLIEQNSSECGYVPPIVYEYQWILTSATTCVGYDKYYLYKQQQRQSGTSTWYDVVPTTTSYDANGTQTPSIAESASTDCGYVPPITPIYKWENMNINTDYWCDECIEPQYSEQYLTFIPTTASSTFSFSKSIQYSLDSGETWTTLAANTNSPSVSVGQKIMWKNTTQPSGATFSSSSKFDVEGNVMSLIYGDNFVGETDLSNTLSAFYHLFNGNTNVVNAENMVLAATNLGFNCYSNMFYGCSSLTKAPTICATTLNIQSCESMFFMCSSLTTPPKMYATTVDTNSCHYMFGFCTSLTTSPELPATTLVQGCYDGMFYYCTSLRNITCLATDISDTNCTNAWTLSVASSGTFTKASSMTSWTTGTSGIPSGWTVTNYTS